MMSKVEIEISQRKEITEKRNRIISEMKSWMETTTTEEGYVLAEGEGNPSEDCHSFIEINNMNFSLYEDVTVKVTHNFVEIHYKKFELCNIHISKIVSFEIWV